MAATAPLRYTDMSPAWAEVMCIEFDPVCACTAVSATVQLTLPETPHWPRPPSKPAFCPVRKFPPSWNWSPPLTFAASATVIWMLVVELVPCPIPAHPCARFSASPDFEYVAARPVPCGLFPGLIPGSQNADWPPATGDWADAAHCVPATELNESTVIAGGGAERPDSGDGKSTTTGTSVRPYGSASKLRVRMPIGNRFRESTPPHCTTVACARKQSNRSGSAVPVPA